jgi:hypothetical protein
MAVMYLNHANFVVHEHHYVRIDVGANGRLGRFRLSKPSLDVR